MAARYWVGSNGTWDATAGTKWALTSGGAGGQAVPTSSDDVFFDNGVGTGNITISGSRVCKSLTCTGYVGTLDGTATPQLTISGDMTLGAGMTNNLTGTILIIATSSINTNGISVSSLTTVSNVTYTLLSNITITVRWNCNSSTATTFAGAFNVTVTGDWNTNNTSGNITTTNTTVTLAGNSTWTGHVNAGTVVVGFAITINCTTLSITAFNSIGNNTSITFTAGTITTSASTLICRGTGIVFNTFGMTWGNINFTTTTVSVTLSSVLNMSGTFTMGVITTLNGSTMNIGGGLSHISANNIQGTTNLVLNGTGTWNHTAAGGILNNLTINTAGVITFGSTLRYGTGTLTYTAGSVISTGSTLFIALATTLNTNGMSFASISISGTTTITNNSRLTLTNTLTYASGSVITFAGTEGWTTNSFYILTSNNISHVLVATKEYIVTTYFESISTTNSLKDSLISATPGTKAIFTLNYGATQNVGFTNATDIDSSRGQTIWTFNGVVTTTFNWNVFTSSSNTNKSFII